MFAPEGSLTLKFLSPFPTESLGVYVTLVSVGTFAMHETGALGPVLG